MYTKTLLASAVLMATTALAGSPGQAVIVNSCSYPVYLAAVPASGGGHSETSKTLATGESWSTTWTSLSNGNGWSLKLSKTAQLSNILQYEYTYHNDGIIWYDLSAVDGNPWAGNWAVSSESAGCNPRQAWYRYDTDDAFGMQDCSSDSSIKVTLCSGESQAGAVVSSVVAAVTQAVAAVQAPNVAVAVAPTTTAIAVAPTTTAIAVAPTTTAVAVPTTTAKALQFNGANVVNANASPVPTTLATVASPAAPAADQEIVTEIVTVVETAIAYETYVPEKRHIHHPAHPHNA